MSEKPDPLHSLSSQVNEQTPKKGLPPVEKWNPPFSGDLDMRIKRDGSWFYLGTPILRKELVRLFSTILKREGDEYFLVTPVEKFRITVEDAPLLAISVQEKQVDGQLVLEFETLTGDSVIADAQHPIRVAVDATTNEPSPYVLVRTNLEARIARNVFYQLVDNAEVDEANGASRLCVTSAGQRFLLGSI